MIRTIVSGGLKALVWGLALIGFAGLLVAAIIATPIRRPPELASISATARAVDRSDMPGIDRFHARDGTELAYRHYPARSPVSGQIALVVHGSSGSSVAVHALAKTLAARGIDTYAPDIRGHGASGTRGDIVYLGQLEDDLADFVAEIRKVSPTAPLTLIGHSSGGGFALRVAGSSLQNLFQRTVLLAPYLGYDAPSSRQNAGGWANPDIPRFLGLTLLRRLGIVCCEIVADDCVRGRPGLQRDPGIDLFLSPDAQFRQLARLSRRSFGCDQAGRGVRRRRRRIDGSRQIQRCRGSTRLGHVDRRCQSHGDRERSKGRICDRR